MAGSWKERKHFRSAVCSCVQSFLADQAEELVIWLKAAAGIKPGTLSYSHATTKPSTQSIERWTSRGCHGVEPETLKHDCTSLY